MSESRFEVGFAVRQSKPYSYPEAVGAALGVIASIDPDPLNEWPYEVDFGDGETWPFSEKELELDGEVEKA